MALSPLETEIVFVLAESLTGSSQKGDFRKDVLVTNVERRILATESRSLLNYLKYIVKNPSEKSQLISALTIHTTSWFREAPHLKILENYIKENTQGTSIPKNFKIWSAACSTGEEPYTFALNLFELQKKLNNFDFVVHGSDLDPESVNKAKKGQYPGVSLLDIPEVYHQHLTKLKIISKTKKNNEEQNISVSTNVKNKCHFFTNNLMKIEATQLEQNYDVVICRNVLIYFKPEDVQKIIKNLLSKLKDGGLLILGHSESFTQVPVNLKSIGASSYVKLSQEMMFENLKQNDKNNKIQMKNKNVLVVDDSPTMRSVLRKILTEADFIVDDVESAEKATDKLRDKNFDLITLDLNMPGENGVHWLQRQRQQNLLKTPVVIISDTSAQDAEKAFGALAVGAQEHFTKKELAEKTNEVVSIMKSLVQDKNQQIQMWQASMKNLNDFQSLPNMICIGAGTGGPNAIIEFLTQLKKPSPPIVIVQHMKSEFSEMFLKKITEETGFVSEPFSDLVPLKNNTVYTAVGDYHLEVERRGTQIYLTKSFSPPFNNKRPSIDYFFKSVARADITTVSILFSGNGVDGVNGYLDISKKNKSLMLVQDELSATIFDLPKKCLELGAAHKLGNPAELAKEVNQLVHGIKTFKKGVAA